MRNYLNLLKFYAYQPLDIAGLAVIRILYGLIIIYESWFYSQEYVFNNYLVGHLIYFKYRFFEWVNPVDKITMQFILVIYGIAGLFICLGLCYRLASLSAALCISYIFLLDSSSYLNHFYLLIIFAFLMFFIPAHHGWSLRAYFYPQKARAHIASWAIWALRLQLIIVYSYAALAKMNVDWINGMPLYDWIGSLASDTGFEYYLDYAPVIYLFSYGGLLYDLLIIPGLLYKPTRALSYCFSIGFHLMNYYLFNIGIFPWFMLASTTIFFDSSWPREVLNFFFHDKFRIITNFSETKPEQITFFSSVGFFCLFMHFSFQTLFPLRHFIYPHYVGWSEEGHNFSWHMKLRDKNGIIMFSVRDPTTHEVYQIDNRKYLSPHQIHKLATRPYLALQFAHWLRDTYSKADSPKLEVYADSWISLNNREPQRLIDPSVNLSLVNAKEFNNPWILPLCQPVWNAVGKKNRFGPALKNNEITKKATSRTNIYARRAS
jgi:hypothetical protein